MRHVLKSAVAALTLLSSAAAFGDSITTYDLNNVTLSASGVTTGSGGTLTGFFTVDYTTNTLTNWQITSSASSPFPIFTFTPSDSTPFDGLPLFLQATDGVNTFQLQLFFTSGTTPLANNTAITTGTSSFVSEPIPGLGQSRFVTGGTVVIDTGVSPSLSVVPLPASFWMGGSLLGAVAIWSSRRKLVQAD